jgi:hypothetical protein
LREDVLQLVQDPWLLFPVLFLALALMEEAGFRLRAIRHDIDEDRQRLIESARDASVVLLSLLLGFSLPMALDHYEHRRQLMVDESSAIATALQRSDLLPEPFRSKVRELLKEDVDARVEFGNHKLDAASVTALVARADNLQAEMWQESVASVQKELTFVTPLVLQAVGSLADFDEQRLAAEEKRIPGTIWLILVLISAMTCFIIGCSLRRRWMVATFLFPLSVAVVFSLLSELDNPRTGVIHVEQQSMRRLQSKLMADHSPGADAVKSNPQR